ncbi:hypothetical protein TCAL_17009 [Tigriopus californicus]|uniref:superoxide dismutase n=1 Tax=Tigriopus californicus TaxID=6832 RepID=A0A553PFM5_TIGCA|nr:hypothetical protein TCAL_17009 [Tigriopus californicus]
MRSKHTLPDLPYDYNALEPVISAEIMQLHHSKHHATYVNNLNVAEEKLHDAVNQTRSAFAVECNDFGYSKWTKNMNCDRSMMVLVDLAGRYLRDLGSHCQSQAELSNRSQANILDVARTLADFRIQTADLADYADCLPRGSGPTAGGIPYFPRPSVTQLNFLKPGSREVLHRKVYVNDYFPPMYPNLEERKGRGVNEM